MKTNLTSEGASSSKKATLKEFQNFLIKERKAKAQAEIDYKDFISNRWKRILDKK